MLLGEIAEQHRARSPGQEIRRDHILFIEAETLFSVALQPQ